MQFSFTSEQEEFRSVLRRFLEEKSPPTVVRRLMETEAGWDREGWRELNEQLGLTGVHIPEAYGGQGFGFVELGIVLEEMGRALLCAPYFASTVLAATAIMNAGTRGAEARAAAADRAWRHHRHPGLHRTERTLGRRRASRRRRRRRTTGSGWTG